MHIGAHTETAELDELQKRNTALLLVPMGNLRKGFLEEAMLTDEKLRDIRGCSNGHLWELAPQGS